MPHMSFSFRLPIHAAPAAGRWWRAAFMTMALATTIAACTSPDEAQSAAPPADSSGGDVSRVAGTEVVVRDTTVQATFEAAGTAEPLQQSTLSTKLMSTVTAVLVHEGDRVSAGQPLVRLDARDLRAKEAQVNAAISEAEAVHRDAEAHAARIRALWADSAATRVQLENAETGLARAAAGLRSARATAGEVQALSSYATIRAPFSGIVTRRFVDPGAFAAPGTPLVALQDASQLRLTVSAAPDAVRGLRRGNEIEGTIEGLLVTAIIEGVVPGASGNMYTVNALVPNAERAILAGSAATLVLPLGERLALVVPARAILREGDLTGVTLRTAHGDETRWVRLGATAGDLIEVTAGLRAGDRIVVPTAPGEM
jgi:RND family efflux transporter MFP subunit